jgi:tetratricopeptide (TPR) repeat protein
MPRKQQSLSARGGAKAAASEPNSTVGLAEQSVSPEDRKDAQNPTRWRAAYALIPTVLALLTSINTLRNQFASDDQEQVLNNSFIRNLSNLPAAFTKSVWSFAASDIIFTANQYFRPAFNSLFTINYGLFGTSAFGWHLVNILIHGAVTLLVFLVSEKVTGRKLVAVVAAALFAVHPVHAEPVAWVSGVTDPLMALFLLPAFYFYLRFREDGRWYLLAFTLGFYFCALLSKEPAIALPVVVAYCELFHFSKAKTPLAQRLVQASKCVAFLMVPTAIYLLIRLNAVGLGTFGAQPRYPLVSALLTIPLAVVKYLGLMFIPFGYSYQHYTELVQTIGSISFLAPFAVLLTLAGGVALVRSKLLTFAVVWFIAMLAPALASLRSFEPAYLVQERYLYLPSVGICLAITLGIEWVGKRDWLGSRQLILPAALTAISLLVWSAAYIRQNRTWDNSISVYKNSVAVAPLSATAHALLSRTYYDAGRPREAETEARTALDLDSKCSTAYMNLSYFASQSGKLDKACEYLESAIGAIPENAMTRQDLATVYLNLGMIYPQRKMFDHAEQSLLRSIELSPRAAAWYYTGQFYFDQGRFDDALAMYEKTLAEVPGWFAPVHLKLGLTYEGLKNLSRAEVEFNKYLALAPNAPDRDAVKKHITAMKGGATPAKSGP